MPREFPARRVLFLDIIIVNKQDDETSIPAEIELNPAVA